MEYYITLALIALAAIQTCVMCAPMLKVIQLSGYKVRGAVAWWKASNYDVLVRYSSLMLFAFITNIIFVTCFSSYQWVRCCGVAFYNIFALVFSLAARGGSNKLKFTGRMIRLCAVTSLSVFVLAAGVAWAAYASYYCQTLVALLAIAAPFLTLAANAVTSPFEKLNNKKYIKRAKAKLAQNDPIVIGITGSFGKTTAKNLLAAMLERKYTVLATPGSYNTPMGVCKTINDSLADQQVLIAEMGARYRGDIRELCDIVTPTYGIITAIGDMHLETMGSRSVVQDTKFELGEALPQNGLLVLNGYNAPCAELGDRATACKKVVVGTTGVMYEKSEIGKAGTSFDLVIDGERRRVSTRLLGAHIAELVCVCAALAAGLGVGIDDIAVAVQSAEPVEHRLQLLTQPDSTVTVIDDAFNSNPIGAKNALDVLGCFDGAKIIITPGFVELGALEKPSNVELGWRIAGVCDYAFLVGSRAEDIKKGAVSGGMAEDKISIFASRDEAVNALKSIDGAKSVLFENDLPDNIK